MMVLALGPTVWIAVGDADIPAVVERIAQPVDVLDPIGVTPTPREMPAPAPLAMPLQEF
jgi:hypothetical protein